MIRSALCALALGACSFSGPGASGTGGDASTPDGNGDAGADATVLGAWGTPVRVTALEFGQNPPADSYDDPSITDSGMLYFAARASPNPANSDIYRAQRMANGSFSEPETVVELSNTNVTESTLWVERDHSRIVFARSGDMFEATRDAVMDVWNAPVELTELNTGFVEGLGQLTNGGLTLYFVSDRDNPSVFDIFRATRPSLGEPFDTLDKLPVSTDTLSQVSVHLSDDELSMFWSEKPAAAATSAFEIVFSERATTSEDFGAGTPISEVNATNAVDSDFTPSPDLRSAFFASDRANTAEPERIFFVER